MAKLSSEVQALFNEVDCVVFGTADKEGQPDISIVAMKKIIDDETVYLSDQFFNKTLANVLLNPKVAITFWDANGAYEIHGTARYVNEGEEFEEQAAWVNAIFEEKGSPVKAKGGCFVHVDSVFTESPGPTAGDEIA